MGLFQNMFKQPAKPLDIEELFSKPIINFIYDHKNDPDKVELLRSIQCSLSNIAPSFAILYAIGEFVRDVEIVYNYKNNEEQDVYSLLSKQKGCDMNFSVKVENGVIEYRLTLPDTISVEMHRNTGNKMMSRWTFRDGECKLNDIQSELLMERIMDKTMFSFEHLLSDILAFYA